MFGWFRSTPTDEPVLEQAQEWIEEDPQLVYHYFSETTGIHFEHKREITTLKLVRFAKEHHSHCFSDLLSRLKGDGELFQKLVNFLTVNETYFFREMDQIHYMAREIKKTSAPIRILCAPGSTGEEPYSIAIILCEAGIDMKRVTIVSMDINTEAIRCAQEAVYSKRSLHRMDKELQERYFLLEGEKYHLIDTIRNCVEFRSLNLFEADVSQLGTFDYIFSRNMLIYFDAHKKELAIQRLSSMVKDVTTVLFFGHADIVNSPEGLKEHYVDQTKFFTKVG
jgi:chemotaxis protein methyltransferase CheR